MYRRTYLVTIGAGISGLSGCTGGRGSESTIKDSDGDGMIDSHDYAPKDPKVQEKSDVSSAETITPAPKTTATAQPTATPTREPTEIQTPTATLTSTPTPTPQSNTLVVDDSYWNDTSHIRSFSSQEVTVVVHPDEPSTNSNQVELYAALVEFPREQIVDEVVGSIFNRTSEKQEQTVRIDSSSVDIRTKYHYIVGLVPKGTVATDIDYSNLTLIMETDPFKFSSDRKQIQRTGFDGELHDDSGQNYSRNSVEGAYQLEISGRTGGRGWTVGFFAYKSAHAVAQRRSRGRSYPEYVNFELTGGTGAWLAKLLKDEAEALGYSGHNLIEFVIDFVQSLPYVPDDVSRGYDQYTKFIMETITEMGGDCEDTAIMLSSILQAEPFDYDMVLIQPPGHMAAGIWQEDPSGYYWARDGRKYAYIETTGQGWGIGDLPEDYRGSQAYVHQV